MRGLYFLLLVTTIVVGGCTSTPVAAAVTCPNVSLSNTNGECDFTTTEACSDGAFYEIDCGDDSTCTCTQNGMGGMAFIASDQMFGFCSSLQSSQLNELSLHCGWNLNP